MLTHSQRNLINRFIGIIEKNFVEPFLDLRSVNVNPIFLVGPPRSGTTVIYQWLIYYLNERVAYISRLADMYPDGSFLLNWLSLRILGMQIDVNRPQHYGQIKGLMAPAEGNRLWPWYEDSLSEKEKLSFHHIYDRTDYNKSNNITFATYVFLHKIIRKQCLLMNSCLIINKSTHNITRIIDLKKLFPKAKFLCIIRDGRDVTKSLVKARTDLFGNAWHWWNVKPSNWDNIHWLPPHISCGKQWEGLLNDMEDQLKEIPDSAYTFIRYEDFLMDPYKELEKIYQFFDLKYNFINDQRQSLIYPDSYENFFSKKELNELNDDILGKLKQWGYILK
jgi:hypothetical protein